MITLRYLTLFFALLTLPVFAADQNLPIQIEADSAVVDEKHGVSIYSGNVSVSQGTLSIQASEVQVHAPDNEITRIVAIGTGQQLASYQQSPAESDPIHAEANQIVYFVKEDRLQFVGDASLSQAGDKSFSGETISYDVRTRRVNAKDRVTTIFTPSDDE